MERKQGFDFGKKKKKNKHFYRILKNIICILWSVHIFCQYEGFLLYSESIRNFLRCSRELSSRVAWKYLLMEWMTHEALHSLGTVHYCHDDLCVHALSSYQKNTLSVCSKVVIFLPLTGNSWLRRVEMSHAETVLCWSNLDCFLVLLELLLDPDCHRATQKLNMDGVNRVACLCFSVKKETKCIYHILFLQNYGALKISEISLWYLKGTY